MLTSNSELDFDILHMIRSFKCVFLKPTKNSLNTHIFKTYIFLMYIPKQTKINRSSFYSNSNFKLKISNSLKKPNSIVISILIILT